MKKNGFTLAELVLALGIIGIITAVGIFTFRPYDHGYKFLYSNTYYILDRALYNASVDYIPGNEKDREPFKEKVKYYKSDGTTDTVDVNDDQGAVRLCQDLIQYINTVSTSCSTSSIISGSPSDSDFSTKTPMFVTGNGIRFWISGRYPQKVEDPEGEEEEEEDTDTFKFFIIYADLNGKKLPNSLEYKETGGLDNRTKDPDIFAFAALDMGRICPIGVVEVDSRYLTTRIRYQDSDYNSKYSKKSVPLIYAKAEAWNYYISSEAEKDNILTNEAPLSFTDYVRRVIYKKHGDSPIYSYFIDKDTSMRDFFNEKYPEGKRPVLNSAPPNVDGTGGFGCAEHSHDECDVIVDKYLY